ncbi:MAG: Ni-sirohydrochlorin a,c-diamide reductive cyclase catalytic subunit, F430 biosynthesis enzyme CfbC [Candidatus Methanolliviera sp. GoM_oil]|nr:MAG: Ni-sirohydrochlorin a,c-diamide reductive cyclase catalytic subunit, F430 biosynthesis enzyme CfbC [Candidatus Methanolliviera sp. GoM_oil]
MITLHPRPNAIAAALYTLRDFDIDLIVIHGPPGCCFKHARLLEEDGVTVVTTGMDEERFIFGGHDILIDTLRRSVERFRPKTAAVVGTCASMIVGEDLQWAVEDAGLDIPVMAVDIHAGHEENTAGVIAVLKAAVNGGFMDEEEFERQKRMMKLATEVEEKYGAAYKDYITPSRGDSKYEVSKRLLEVIKDGKKGICILNAKKETAYMFADIMLAVNEVSNDILNIANLSTDVGLSRIRRYAENISRVLVEKGVEIHHITGGLDEYASTGEKASEIVKEEGADFLVIAGVPHAVSLSGEDYEIFSITNGPRQVEPMKELLKHQHVIVEMDLHSKTMGANTILESEFGAILRGVWNN